MEPLRSVVLAVSRLRPLLPTYLHLLASALIPIYLGAHASLSAPSSARSLKPRKRRSPREGDDDIAEASAEISAGGVASLAAKDAIALPVIASMMLSSLYFIIKWLEDPSILNKILGYYFMQVGLVFLTTFSRDTMTVLCSMLLPRQYSHRGTVWKANQTHQKYDATSDKSPGSQTMRSSPLPALFHRIPLPEAIRNGIWRFHQLAYARFRLSLYIYRILSFQAPVSLLDGVAVCASLSITLFSALKKPWYLSNVVGYAFCYGSIPYMSPTTFWTGTLVLSALFCYDIYFVFFTPVMVTVATKLDVPIKLLFPRPHTAREDEDNLQSFAMLGLGDIVVPGMMMALALRFDLYLHYLRRQFREADGKIVKATYRPATGGWGERFWVGQALAGPDLKAKMFRKTYFWAGMGGYAIGMVVTLIMMQVSDSPQPALLYLVPSVLGALWTTAALNGDIGTMWKYTEEQEASKKQDPLQRETRSSTEEKTDSSTKKHKKNIRGDADLVAAIGNDSTDPSTDSPSNKPTMVKRDVARKKLNHNHVSSSADSRSDSSSCASATSAKNLKAVLNSKQLSKRADALNSKSLDSNPPPETEPEIEGNQDLEQRIKISTPEEKPKHRRRRHRNPDQLRRSLFHFSIDFIPTASPSGPSSIDDDSHSAAHEPSTSRNAIRLSSDIGKDVATFSTEKNNSIINS